MIRTGIREGLALATLGYCAQVPAPSAGALGEWFVCAACASLIIDRGFSAWRQIQGGPQQREIVGKTVEVKASPVYQTVPACEAKHKETMERMTQIDEEVDGLRSEVLKTIEKISLAGEDRVRRIHIRIDQYAEKVSELVGEIRASRRGQ